MPSATVSPWTAFHIEKLKQEKLENEITAVALSCQKGCEKSHVTRCPTCYRHILSLYRERYVTDYDSREWFAGRTEFIAEIANMLAAAEVGKSGIDLLSIEARINAEKRIWQQFAQYQRDPEFSVEIEKQRALLESKTDEELDEMACRLARTGTEDQAKEYENIFFAQFSNEQKSKYIAMLAQGKTMDEVCDAIKENSARYKNQKVVYDKEKRELEAKLEQLRRAKNANEQQKRKKKEAVSQKEKAQSLNLPSCSACGTKSDLAGYFECTLCWVLAEAGAISRSTVYCGEKCSAKHQGIHNSEKHKCSAGSKCEYSREDNVPRDQTDAELRESISICSECLFEHHIAASYCEPACAKNSFQSHRDNFHLPNRKPEDRARDEAALDKINFTTYTAKNIQDSIVSLAGAIKKVKAHSKLEP